MSVVGESSHVTLALALLLSGCSTTVPLTSPLEANRKIAGGPATLHVRPGKVYEGREILVGLDSTRFVERNTDSACLLSTRAILSVQFSHHVAGALEGLMFGSLGGLAAGGVVGALVISARGGGNEGMGVGLLILTAGVIGGGGGSVIGLIKGHDYTLIFPDDTTTVGPPLEDRSAAPPR